MYAGKANKELHTIVHTTVHTSPGQNGVCCKGVNRIFEGIGTHDGFACVSVSTAGNQECILPDITYS